MRSRVIPGWSPTIDLRSPVKRLNSVDLPTLGRPTTATNGRASRVSVSSICSGSVVIIIAVCARYRFQEKEFNHEGHEEHEVKAINPITASLFLFVGFVSSWFHFLERYSHRRIEFRIYKSYGRLTASPDAAEGENPLKSGTLSAWFPPGREG